MTTRSAWRAAREEAERLGSGAAMAYVEEVRRGAKVKKNPNAFD